MKPQIRQILRRRLFTDWEGVFGFNDAAAEALAHFLAYLFGGNEEMAAAIFAKISLADDFWAKIRSPIPRYRVGMTLIEIVALLKAAGVTNKAMEEYAGKTLRLIPGAQETFGFISSIMDASIVTTSYSSAALAIGKAVGIDPSDISCTVVNIDDYEFSAVEIARILEIIQEIAKMGMLEWPSGAKLPKHFSADALAIVDQMTQIFFGDPEGNGLMSMPTYRRILEEVTVIGGPGKKESIQDGLEKTGGDIRDVMIFGDSITDVEAEEEVREGGGVSVAVNGNEHILRVAEFGCMVGHTVPLSVLASCFAQGGRECVIEAVANWSHSGLEKLGLDSELLLQLSLIHPEKLPIVRRLSEVDLERFIRASERFRKKLRGEVGKLG